MAADYTHFIHTQQERSEVCVKRTCSHNDGLDFPDSEGSPVSQTLIAALQNPALYPHPVEGFQVIETHISWVILTGPFAYKVKKPVNFGFLDFTGLEAREHFCTEELRLNQRLTDDLYLEVLPVTGSAEAPQLGGEGPAIEYLLKMRQFPQSGLLSTLQANGELTTAHIDEMAEQIAAST
jgi:aminoglycoside phosphotransferase family enzyme